MKRLVKRLRNASRKACETRFGRSERAFERCDRRQRPSTPRSFIAHLMRQQLSIAAYADIDASCFRRMLPTVWGETPTRRAISLVGADGTVGVHEISGGAAVAEYASRMIGLKTEMTFEAEVSEPGCHHAHRCRTAR
jgi:hypothetical protein